MAEKYYIGDTHFYHDNIIGFDNRPWITTEEMNEGLIENWNNQVTSKDWVYIAGDFIWSKDPKKWAEILKRLKGNKVLCVGNHDPNHITNYSFYDKVYKICGNNFFKDIQDYYKILDNGKTVILSHYYLANYEHSYDPMRYMIYAHSHVTIEADLLDLFTSITRKNKQTKYDNCGNFISVSCCRPYMKYMPQTLDYLIYNGLHYYQTFFIENN